jgi:hypothetical protein
MLDLSKMTPEQIRSVCKYLSYGPLDELKEKVEKLTPEKVMEHLEYDRRLAERRRRADRDDAGYFTRNQSGK